MCNAWNHAPDCTCGWGGEGHAGRGGGRVTIRYQRPMPARVRFASSPFSADGGPNASCPVCGAAVYFYRSPTGGRVFFDELGHPWPKHPCTDNPALPVGPPPPRPTSSTPGVPVAVGGQEWRPVQVASTTRRASTRVVPCRDLLTGKAFEVFTDEGFAVQGTTIASLRRWTSEGWSMLSLVRLEMKAEPKLVAVRREPHLIAPPADSTFWKDFERESFILAGGREGAKRRREMEQRARLEKEAAQREKAERKAVQRADKKAQQRARVIERSRLVAEAERLARDSGPESLQQFEALAREWRANPRLPKALESDLGRRWAQAESRIRASADQPRPPRKQASPTYESLVAAAEALADVGDWNAVSADFKVLAEKWTKLSATTSAAPDLKDRFRTAYLLAKDADHRTAIKRRLEILREARHLSVMTDRGDIDRTVADLVARWNRSGYVRPEIDAALQRQWSTVTDTLNLPTESHRTTK